MKTTTIFKNEYVRVERYADCIRYYDEKDQYNDYQGFTQNIQGLAKATVFIEQLKNDAKIKMSDISKILSDFKLKPHTYCGMD